MCKSELRRKMRTLRDRIPEREKKSAAICENIRSMPEYARASCVMLYMPIRSEADVRGAIRAALADGKRVCLPVCRADGEMDAVAFVGWDAMVCGSFGVQEPVGEIVAPETIDLVLCPGLAFDPCGGRLGYGKGYYDRYLEKVHAFWAGICYTECIVEKVPADAHDIAMKAIVTQAGVMRIGGN